METGIGLQCAEDGRHLTPWQTDAGAGLFILTLKRVSAPFGARQGAISYRLLSTAVAPILAIPETRRRP